MKETIQEYNPETDTGNGFKFAKNTPEEFLSAVRRAIILFSDKSSWEALIRNNMALDFSWDSVIPQYLVFYRVALEKRRS